MRRKGIIQPQPDLLAIDYSTEEKIRVASALNMCVVSVSQIVDYADLVVLEQEYDGILNNLNIKNFVKDEAMLSCIKQILNVINYFRISAAEKAKIEREYQQKARNAIYNAMPQPGTVVATAIGIATNPITGIFSALMAVGTGYMNYRRSKSQMLLEKEGSEFKLQVAAAEQLHGLRRELFECAWRLSDKYGFEEEYRLTEKQIKNYNEILLDADPIRRFERLEYIKDNFKAYAPYWYNIGNAAREISQYHITEDEELNAKLRLEYRQKALSYFETFEKVHQEFMREDEIAATCKLEHIALLNPDNDETKISQLLSEATRLAGHSLDLLQMCAFVNLSLGRANEAGRLFLHLVNEKYNLDVTGKLLSRIYIESDDKFRYELLQKRIGEIYVYPYIKDAEESSKLYITSMSEDVVDKLNKLLDMMLKKYCAHNGVSLRLGYEAKTIVKDLEEALFSFRDKVCNLKIFDIILLDELPLLSTEQRQLVIDSYTEYSKCETENRRYRSCGFLWLDTELYYVDKETVDEKGKLCKSLLAIEFYLKPYINSVSENFASHITVKDIERISEIRKSLDEEISNMNEAKKS
jgi:hypothetical protein